MLNHQRLLGRFLRYVQIDTTASDSSGAYPSSSGQLVLGKLLANELLQPLGFGAVRQVHVARRAFCTRGDFLVGRRR